MSILILELIGLLCIHWIVMLLILIVFDLAHIPKEIKIFIDKSTVVTNIFRIQACDSIMCGCFCIGFIDIDL